MDKPNQVIFFDGYCNLCNGFIDFVVRWDKSSLFKVASLQGETAKELLPRDYVEDLSSVVLLRNQKTFTKTAAVLRIISNLHWVFKPMICLLIVPAFIRDPFYNFVASNRYRFFGKKETCRLPTPEERAHFLP
jgi:predicted DCC family thiol-disulfide oxidoreductase YuxK